MLLTTMSKILYIIKKRGLFCFRVQGQNRTYVVTTFFLVESQSVTEHHIARNRSPRSHVKLAMEEDLYSPNNLLAL